jgi:hypothetical protein
MRLQKTVSLLSADTSDVARLTPKQLVKLLPFDMADLYGTDGAYEMYADMYGEQAYEMRANGMNPGTFKQWLLRQVSRRRFNAARN